MLLNNTPTYLTLIQAIFFLLNLDKVSELFPTDIQALPLQMDYSCHVTMLIVFHVITLSQLPSERQGCKASSTQWTASGSDVCHFPSLSLSEAIES